MRYQAFMNSIIPDSLYLQRLFDERAAAKALQTWKRNISRPGNTRSSRKNDGLTGRTRPTPGSHCSITRWNVTAGPLPDTTPSWNIFPPTGCAGNGREAHPFQMEDVCGRRIQDPYPEHHTGGFGRHCGTFHRLRENGREPEKEGAGRRDVQEVCEVPIRVRAPRYGHKGRRQLCVLLQAGASRHGKIQKKIDLTLDGLILSPRTRHARNCPPSDTLTYFVSSMVQFLDRTPRYRKRIITRKDEVSLRAYGGLTEAAVWSFPESLGSNQAGDRQGVRDHPRHQLHGRIPD